MKRILDAFSHQYSALTVDVDLENKSQSKSILVWLLILTNTMLSLLLKARKIILRTTWI